MQKDGYVLVREAMIDRMLDRAAYHEGMADVTFDHVREHHSAQMKRAMMNAERLEAQIVAHLAKEG